MNAPQLWTPQDVANILNAKNLVPNAEVAQGNSDHPTEFQVITFTLTSGKALVRALAQKVSVPFRSLYVISSSHPSLKIRMIPNTIDTLQGDIPLSVGDSIDMGQKVAAAYIFWDSQSPSVSALTVTVLFSVNANVRSGSLSSIVGGVKTDLYTAALMTNQTLAAATLGINISDPVGFTQVPSYVANGIDRQVLIYNSSGATLYVGPTALVDDGSNAAGVNIGQPVLAGDSFKWNNRAYLYGYSVAGGVINSIIEY